MTSTSFTPLKTVVLPGGHTLKFIQRGPGAGYALIEWTAPPAIPGPPVHIHRLTDEGFYVVEGAFGFQAGEQTWPGATGAYVFVARGQAHTFWNAGPTPAKLLIVISPAGFEAYFEALAEGLAAAGDDPSAGMTVRRALSGQYDIEVIGPPRQTALVAIP
jgi:quercetin dioxygenase-like cupin family protein